MAFDWREYLSVALALAAKSDEASWRSSTSRAYYACFGVATEKMESEGFVASTYNGSHNRTWKSYATHSDRRYRKVAAEGQRLKRRRVKADYRAGAQFASVSASADCQQAAALLARIDAL